MATKIGLLSDTHGYLDPQIFELFKDCHEIWHAGDIGTEAVADALEERFPMRAVYGNIDDAKLRARYPEHQQFEREGLRIWITHIAGAAGRYQSRIRAGIQSFSPGLLVCGHSHILKVMPVPAFGLLHINPGACGRHGFHKIRTVLRFEIERGKVQRMEAIELGPRSRL